LPAHGDCRLRHGGGGHRLSRRWNGCTAGYVPAVTYGAEVPLESAKSTQSKTMPFKQRSHCRFVETSTYQQNLIATHSSPLT